MKKKNGRLAAVILCLCLFSSCMMAPLRLSGASQAGTMPPDVSETGDASEPVLPDIVPSRHYYEKLDATQKQAYAIILREASSHQKKAILPQLTQEELSLVFQSVYYDNPQLICLENKFGWGTSGPGAFIELHYADTAEACRENTEKLERALEAAMHVLHAGMDEFQKELALHDWLASHCIYSMNSSSPYTAYGALVEGGAVCEGYAKAMQLLLQRAGIRSFLMTGKVETGGEIGGHMWNVVTIGGENYHLDVTWDASRSEEGLIQHAYFNLSDTQISGDHFDFDVQDSQCHAQQENFFLRSGIFFTTYDELVHGLARALPAYLKEGKNVFEFRLAAPSLYEEARKKLFEEGEIYAIMEEAAGEGFDPRRYDSIAHTGVEAQQTIFFQLQERR